MFQVGRNIVVVAKFNKFRFSGGQRAIYNPLPQIVKRSKEGNDVAFGSLHFGDEGSAMVRRPFLSLRDTNPA